jgi:transglutaminase-like putative cysteine protease
MKKYLESSEFIDWENTAVQSKAKELAEGAYDAATVAQRCFEFVRDEIKHSCDNQANTVSCKASDVLLQGTGFCYAKSHLLAALLRANDIPAGLCYQRLTNTDAAPFCLHGLNAVYLERFGWYRIDPRGNKPGVNAEFCPPMEKLAFSLNIRGEADLPEIWAEPLSIVVKALDGAKTVQEVAADLPDIEMLV